MVSSLRDFIYVKDVVKVIWWMYKTMINKEWRPEKNGIYNVGTGDARSFNDLANALFKSLSKEPDITYIEVPEEAGDIQFSEAAMVKLKHAGYEEPFTSLEEGIDDYVKNYLIKKGDAAN